MRSAVCGPDSLLRVLIPQAEGHSEKQGRMMMAPTVKTRSEKEAVDVQVSLKALMLVMSQTPEGRRNWRKT